MSKLTTHILDTAQGRPASGVNLTLHRLTPEPALCFTGTSNDDGRVDLPLLEGNEFVQGDYELIFAIGEYFASTTLAKDAGDFLDEVVLRFRLSNDENYHVPLLVSPWSYSTYRGS